jgi:hypothetical protein
MRSGAELKVPPGGFRGSQPQELAELEEQQREILWRHYDMNNLLPNILK